MAGSGRGSQPGDPTKLTSFCQILTGATGTAGAAVLSAALASPSISHISILSRRPVHLAATSPKAHVIIHQDFSSYPPDVLDQLRGATACIWAQGISSLGVKEGEYAKITVDYPLAAAKALASPAFLGDAEGKGKMNFIYLSGEGANADPHAKGQLFARVKGRAERELLALSYPNLHVYALRPAIINPQGRYLAQRAPTLQDRLSTGLGAVAEGLCKGYVVSTEGLARACLGLAVGDGGPVEEGKGVEGEGRLLRNWAVRRLGGM